MFQVTAEEKEEVIANFDHLENLKFSKTRPYAFTEHGAIMAANVCKVFRSESKGFHRFTNIIFIIFFHILENEYFAYRIIYSITV